MLTDADLTDREYAFYVTLNELLLTVNDHIGEARHAQSDKMLGFHLAMASRAMRYALEIYGDQFPAMLKMELEE